MIWFFFTTVKRLDQSLCKINRGGLIFTVLAHSLYLLTQSILHKGLDIDTHIHGDVIATCPLSIHGYTLFHIHGEQMEAERRHACQPA